MTNITEIEIRNPLSLQQTEIYDLQGRKVTRGQLPRGLYIVGGRKILVK